MSECSSNPRREIFATGLSTVEAPNIPPCDQPLQENGLLRRGCVQRCAGSNRVRPTRRRAGQIFQRGSRGDFPATVARNETGKVAGLVFFQRTAQGMAQSRFQFRAFILLFHVFLNPFGQLPTILFGKPFERRFDFSHRAHTMDNLNQLADNFKCSSGGGLK